VNATKKQTPRANTRANAAAREAVIAEYLKALKLPAFAAEYPELVRQAREKAVGTTRTSSGNCWRWKCALVKRAPPKGASRRPAFQT
jgi:hypothetical protein